MTEATVDKNREMLLIDFLRDALVAALSNQSMAAVGSLVTGGCVFRYRMQVLEIEYPDDDLKETVH